MRLYPIVSCLILLCLLTSTCTTENRQVPERYVPINEAHQGGSFHQVNIPEEKTVDVLYDDMQAIRSPEDAYYEAGLGERIVATPDSLIVVTDDRKTIKSIDTNTGQLLHKHSFVGRGPGEYQHITNLQVTGDTVMIADRYLSIVNLYDRKMNLKEEVLLDDLDHTSSRSDIYLMSSRLHYPSATDSVHIISTYNLPANTNSTRNFHNRIIPLGGSPSQYNDVMMDASPSGELLVANPVSPFLFIYRENKLYERYFLELPGLATFHDLTPEKVSSGHRYTPSTSTPIIQPPPIPMELPERGIRMYPFLIDILHTGDNILFYYTNDHSDQHLVAVLRRGTNNRWEHQGNYTFFKDSGELFRIEDMGYSEPWLYLSNHFEEEILKINLSKLLQR